MEKNARRVALRSFLNDCRARLTPEDVGLVSVGRRRVPGLRRDEVAGLCGISLAWYTLLERARDIRVSPQLLDRLSAALRLSESEKVQLFSLAIDELPTIPKATLDSVGAVGREYYELRTFAKRVQAASTVQELAYLTADLIFDLGGDVENAYFISSDLTARHFTFLAQRCARGFDPLPQATFMFSAVHDAKEVLLEGGLFAESSVATKPHLAFAPRARDLGAGRFISKGVLSPRFNGAIGFFQVANEPFTEREREMAGLIGEMLHLSLASRY